VLTRCQQTFVRILEHPNTRHSHRSKSPHTHDVAVKVTHKEVHRINFSKLIQSEGEKITQFVAKTELITGLRNQQHQPKVLAEAEALPALADKIRRLQCLESTEDSTLLMGTSDNTPSVITQQSTSAQVVLHTDVSRTTLSHHRRKYGTTRITTITQTSPARDVANLRTMGINGQERFPSH